jgi:cytochrome c556
VRKSLAGALLFALLAAGCGGGSHVQPATTHAARTRSPEARRYVRDYARLYADIRAMRAEAAKVRHGSLLGTPGLRRTTAKFIEDLEGSILGAKARNRMIDHAAAAVATSCEQCFQMLEAIRPIPQIAGH